MKKETYLAVKNLLEQSEKTMMGLVCDQKLFEALVDITNAIQILNEELLKESNKSESIWMDI